MKYRRSIFFRDFMEQMEFSFLASSVPVSIWPLIPVRKREDSEFSELGRFPDPHRFADDPPAEAFDFEKKT